MSATLAKTPLHEWHVEHGGRMVDFAGWSMPVVYDSTINEHNATRQHASLFDVSHMGRFRFDGAAAAEFLHGVLSRKVTNLKPDQIRYGLVTNEAGGILDDILVYHLIDHDGTPYHALVVNAGNREKIAGWINDRLASLSGAAADVTFKDETVDTVMIAVQGPKAIGIADQLADIPLGDLPYYNGKCCQFNGTPAMVSRTGYTGEDGCEVVVASEHAVATWSRLMEIGKSEGIVAAGLGARDTLRLEAAMPLYGHELSETINPYQAGLGFAVHLKDRSFPGRDALATLKKEPRKSIRVGLQMEGKRAARENYPVVAGGNPVGHVTSGTFSPTLQHSIAMALVDPAFSESGTEVEIDIRGRLQPAKVVDLPFYKRPS